VSVLEWRAEAAAFSKATRRTSQSDLCRVRRALAAVFAGPVGKDVVSRVWRRVKGD